MPHSRQTIGTLIVLVLAITLAACGDAGDLGGPPNMPDAGGAAEPTTGAVDLADTEWVLTSLNGGSLLEGSNITLNFGTETATGFAGCNNVGGEYTAADKGILTIPEIGSTEMGCPTPEGILEQESAYVDALRNAATYRVVDDRLEIANAAGETTLVFARKAQVPMDPADLVGTKWLLRSLDGSELWLETDDGRALVFTTQE